LGESSTKIISKPAVDLQALRESIAVLLQNEHMQEPGTILNAQRTEYLCVINLPTVLGVTSKVHNCHDSVDTRQQLYPCNKTKQVFSKNKTTAFGQQLTRVTFFSRGKGFRKERYAHGGQLLSEARLSERAPALGSGWADREVLPSTTSACKILNDVSPSSEIHMISPRIVLKAATDLV
jgi:hypothetical protein